MAMKFGKREKMVVGSIIGLMVIVALDQLVFREAADKYEKLGAQYAELSAKASSAASVPADFDKEKYNAETSKDEVLMWKIVFGMDLITSQPFVALTKPVKPTLQAADAAAAALAAASGGTAGATTGGDTATDAKDLATKMETYNKKLQEWKKVKEWKDTAIEGILANQIERLISMKTAYEGQQVWPGDAILTADTTATINTQMTNPLLLSFLTGSNKSWQIPFDLTLTGADLQAAVIAVNNQFSIFNIVPETDPTYLRSHAMYANAVAGLDPGMALHMQKPSQTIPGTLGRSASATDYGSMVPVLAKIRLSALIQQKLDTAGGAPVKIDNQTDLNAASLRKILKTNFPDDPLKLYYLHRQLFHLEKLLALARKNGVVSIDAVKLEREFNMVSYQSATEAIQQAQATAGTPPVAGTAGAAAVPAAGGAAAVGGVGQPQGGGLVSGVIGTVPSDRYYVDPYAEPEVMPDAATGATGAAQPGMMPGGAMGGGRYGGGAYGGGAYGGGRYGGGAYGGGRYGGGAYGGGGYGGGYGAAGNAETPAYMSQRQQVGVATLLRITFTASNKNAMQYLYEITRTSDHFRIEGLDIQLPPANLGLPPDMVKVVVLIEAPATIDSVSKPTDPFLVNGKPNPVLGDASSGDKTLAERLAWKKNTLKMDVDGWMKAALKKAGLPLEAPPDPSAAAAGTAPGGAPGAPGGGATPPGGAPGGTPAA